MANLGCFDRAQSALETMAEVFGSGESHKTDSMSGLVSIAGQHPHVYDRPRPVQSLLWSFSATLLQHLVCGGNVFLLGIQYLLPLMQAAFR